MRQVELTQGKFAMVDDIDHAMLSQWIWSFSHGYAVRGLRVDGKDTRVYMHRMICLGAEIDHIDGNKLNNQRCNLRAVQRSANSQNKPARGSVGLKGVTPRDGRYVAQLSFDKKHFYLGRFDNAVEAARAYDAKALELYGPHARLNFPRMEF